VIDDETAQYETITISEEVEDNVFTFVIED